MDNQTVVCQFAEMKKADFFKIQAASHAYSEYYRKKYLKANKFSL